MASEGQHIKCVVVGDGAVGKTCMLISYCKGEFPKKYVPTIFDNYTVVLEVQKKTVHLNLWDTAGQEDYDRLRSLAYNGTNVFIICFSVVNRTSLENVKDKWAPEIERYRNKAPMILVGTKVDLREDYGVVAELKAKKQQAVTRQEGEEVAKEINAYSYVECSARTDSGLKNVFEKAIKSVMFSEPKRKRISCVLL